MEELKKQIQPKSLYINNKQETINKRRKLSENSRSTTSESSGDLRNSFNFLNINEQKQNMNYDYINIPKPFKPTIKQNLTNNSFTQIQNIINNKEKLTLFDDFLKQHQIQSTVEQQLQRQQQQYNVNKMQNKFQFHPFMYWQLGAFGIPLQMNQLNQQTDIQSINPLNYNSVQFQQQQPQTDIYIGCLTKDERKEKVQKYLEKKKNRKWKEIRYSTRKELADNRQRDKGRFIKNEQRLKFDIYDKQKFLKCLEKEANKVKSIENSSWPPPEEFNKSFEEVPNFNLFSNINISK